jgi:hypothetical protein
LSPEDLGLIYGTLLGDASITYPNAHSRFPRLAWVHSSKQQEWSKYKASRLTILNPKLWAARNLGYGQKASFCNTRCHPQLTQVFDIVKPERGVKQVRREWLEQITPEGLAWWYMDDGSLHFSSGGSPSIQLHTEGFTFEENKLLAAWLNELGYAAKHARYTRDGGKQFSYLSLGAAAAGKWLSKLKPFAIPAMAYKFRDH